MLKIENENQLFDYLKSNYFPDLINLNEFDKFSPVDFYSKKYNCYIEAKCRRSLFNGYIIEEDKYKSLKMYKNSKKLYINSLPNGKVYVWDIDKLFLDFYSKYCKRTTDFSNNDYYITNVAMLYEWMGKEI